MPLDTALLQTAAAFTPMIFEPADHRGIAAASTPPAPALVHNSGTPVLDEVFQSPLGKYLAESAVHRQVKHRIEVQIEDRLRELRIDAHVDEEAFSEESVRDLRQFVKSIGITKRPGIFLLDNGNVRALWRDADGQQVGLQFLGDEKAQFVIFSLRDNPRMMARIAGIDSVVGTRARIERDRVVHLICG
jgi:hypothetical protein